MTSSNGNIFRVAGALWEESTGHLVVSSHKGQWRGALMFSLICAWTNDWTNNRDTGYLIRHHTYYDVTVMKKSLWRVNGRIGPPWHFQSRLPFNTLRPRQHGRHFAGDIFKGIFLNENIWIPIKISLKSRVQLTISKHWFRWWIGAGLATSHCLNQWWLVYWRIVYMHHSASMS